MYSVIVAAGGSGRRTGLTERKIWVALNGTPVIEHTVRAFEADDACMQIVIAAHPEDVTRLAKTFKDRATVVEGGLTRTESVHAGLSLTIAPYVLVHDAARPCVTQDVLTRLKAALKHHDAVSLAVPVVDTLKQTHGDLLGATLAREKLVAVQTPQAFIREKLMVAYGRWVQAGKTAYPCDASLYQAMLAEPVHYVLGARTNIKFTTLDDIALLEAVLS
ncbi:MAG: 2-C-methyl-D-erythritol 4-phosphate cytidylyltransferase [Acholeplasmatales bacterium]|nr:MAG: 2-C-methyl-D-erythritol 4-phosphate cytidylyltransferase [Acholeplasmatales bacterium]